MADDDGAQLRVSPGPFVPAHAGSGLPPMAQGVDLRLDGNQGSAPSVAFWRELGADLEALRGYPTGNALEQALAARHGVAVEQIAIGGGADDVLDRIARAVLAPGRTLVLPVPTFEMIERYAALAGATVLAVPWTSGAWPRTAVLTAARATDATMIAIVSPNNPTGLTAVAEDVDAVAAALPTTLIVVDAAYAEYGEDGVDLTARALRWPNVVVVRTFSKAFGLAGLRLGYAIAHPEVARWLRVVGSPFTAGRLARAAALLRLRTGADEVLAHTTAVRAHRHQLTAQLHRLAAAPLPSQANFVLARPSDPGLLRDLLAGLGIGVRAFAFRGMSELASGVRITVPSDRVEFTRLTAAVESALAPQAFVLDFDGVLGDVVGRRPLVAAEQLAALAAVRPVVLVTSCPRRLCESLLERYGFAPFVQHAICEEDGPGKPDPWPVREALRRLGVTRAWMLGDNPGDVQAARAAGVVPFAIEPRGIGAESLAARLRAAGAARLVNSIGELAALLGGR